MNRRKPNIKAWYSLALVMLLCMGLLAAATGTTLARYRSEREAGITFRVRPPEQIRLGTEEIEILTTTDEAGEEVTLENRFFKAATQLGWITETVDGVTVTGLDFAVANGSGETDYSTRDQLIRLRMIGSLSLGTEAPTLTLTLPLEEGEETAKTVTAKATRLVEGTALYYTYGQGWLYTLVDDTGEELTWELTGGELSYLCFRAEVAGEIISETNLLQPYVVAETIDE